jgi:predicted nucleotidyltransferase
MINTEIIRETIYSVIPADIIERVMIFGSAARGDANVGSDIDICIITREKLSYEQAKAYRGQMNRIFAFQHRVATDILLKSSYEYSRYQGVVGAIENEIMRDGVAI